MTMDTAKLEKMKVAELRNELQARGLDTKGVKAILIERLKAAIDNKTPIVEGGTTEIAEISTPSRRSRRTRSMTRSPSPSPVKKAEPSLEPLIEEEKAEAQSEEVDGKKSVETPQETEETEENMEDETSGDNEDVKDDDDDEDEAAEDAPSQSNTSAKEEEQLEEMDSEMVPENGASEEKPAEKMVVDEENPEGSKKEDTVKEKEKIVEKKDKRLSRKRSHSKSRSRSRTRDRSRSRSKSKNSRSRSRSPRGKRSTSQSKNMDDVANEEDEPVIEDKQFGLSWLDSDLHLLIDPVTFTSAKPMAQDIYSLVWSGARTNYGVREGKVCYEVRLAEESNSSQFKDELYVKGLRCGFSTTKTSLLLGEEENSFAYCESGKKALNGEFVEYGKAFKLDDVIGCYLDLDSTPCTIQFTLNGEQLGTAFEFDKTILGEEDALFPHVLTKGYEYLVNFADSENLLGNMERPKRMRRKEKPRKDSVKSEDGKNAEDKWEIVDEAKMDENENEDEKKEDEEEDVVAPESEVEKTKDEDESKTEKEVEEEGDNKSDEAEKAEEKMEEDDEEKSDESKTEVEKEKEEDEKEDEVQKNEGTDIDPKKDDDDKTETEKAKVKKVEEEKVSKSEASAETKKENGQKHSGEKKRSRESRDSDYIMEEVEPEEREEVILLPGYELIALTPEDKFVSGPQRPESRKECEVYLLVGLPGSGKTHWALNHIKENPDKRYHTIGADDLISKMTIDGKPRKSLHKGSWNRVYDLCLQSLSALEEIATKRRRNYIIDQTNAFASAQRRKMKGFGDFKRNAVVCIPSEDELKKRNQLKTEAGTENTIKESTLNYLKASFTLPSLEFGWFDNVIYTDLKDDEAKEEVKRYNEKGNKDIDASRDKRPRRDNRHRDDRRRNDDRRRDDFRGSRWKGNNNNDRRGGSGNRWGPPSRGSSGGGPWRDDRGYGGGGGGGGGRSYDNRNNRYSSGGSGSQNWVNNNRNRYDDRFGGRSGGGGGGGGNRYDSYGGGSRDYRDRGRDRNGGDGDNRRDGGYRSGNQRDFRSGHRDNRTEGSRGGFERSKYTSNDDGYNHQRSSGHQNNSASQGKWVQMQSGGNWGGQHQMPQQQQQNYWGYDQSQSGYANQQPQQQWPVNAADPRQQQQWANWYQNNSQAQQQGQMMPDNNGQQYWSQYSYPNQGDTTVMNSHSSGDGSLKK